MINHTVLGIRVKKGKGSPRKMPSKAQYVEADLNKKVMLKP